MHPAERVKIWVQEKDRHLKQKIMSIGKLDREKIIFW